MFVAIIPWYLRCVGSHCLVYWSRLKGGYDYFDDFLDQQVTLATPMEIATYFGNLEFLGQAFLETRQRIKITGERFQFILCFVLTLLLYTIYILIHSHTHAVNLLIEHHSFSWFFFNLQPVGSKHLISLLFVHRIFKPSNLKGGRGRIQWEKNAKNMGPPYIYSLKKNAKRHIQQISPGVISPEPYIFSIFFHPPQKKSLVFPPCRIWFSSALRMVQLLFHKGADPEDRKQNSLNWKTDGFEVVSRIEKLPPIFFCIQQKKMGWILMFQVVLFFATQLQGTKHNINQPYNKSHCLLTSKLGSNFFWLELKASFPIISKTFWVSESPFHSLLRASSV